MTVYLDNMYVGDKWCHLMADTDQQTLDKGFSNWEEELHAFVDIIGLQRKYYQKFHYDVCGVMITRALKAGAVLKDIKNNHDDMLFIAKLSKKNRKEVVDKL